MVKNAVIVPTGSKGGFYAKQLPDPAVDRAAWMDEGIASYRLFISGLLDVTDNRVSGAARAAPAGRAPRRGRHLPRRRRRQGHGEVLRHRQRHLGRLRLLARRRLRVGRLGGLRPQGHGHHGPWRLGVGQAALPRARGRHADRRLHRRRRRRHERRRLRQRHAALGAHPPGGRLRPPSHLRRPGPRRRHLVRRAAPDVRAARLVVGRLRRVAAVQGRRDLRPLREVGADQRRRWQPPSGCAPARRA